MAAASNKNGNIKKKTERTKTRKQKWGGKQLYGYFKRQTDDSTREDLEMVKKRKP